MGRVYIYIYIYTERKRKGNLCAADGEQTHAPDLFIAHLPLLHDSTGVLGIDDKNYIQ